MSSIRSWRRSHRPCPFKRAPRSRATYLQAERSRTRSGAAADSADAAEKLGGGEPPDPPRQRSVDLDARFQPVENGERGLAVAVVAEDELRQGQHARPESPLRPALEGE